MGGSQAIKLIIGMIQTKALAVFLGPSGVGLMSTFQNLTSLVGTVAGMGIGSSGVRQVAEANGQGDIIRLGRTVLALRRAVWGLGLTGTILTILMAWPLSYWTFGTGSYAWSLAALGPSLLAGNLAMGQTALLQGTRRIADLAKLNIATAGVGAAVAVTGFGLAGERAIIPVILTTSLTSLAVSWWFARRVPVPSGITCGWSESWFEIRPLLGLGFSFMWSGLMTTLAAWATRAMIIHTQGIDQVGMFQAAFSISGIFVGFIIGAMGADFYPALTAVAKDHPAANMLIRQQTEIGVFLATPGLIATLAFAPWVIRLFYSGEFAAASEMLRWFTLGCFGQVLSWPMGFILLAKGKGRLFAITQTVANLLHILLVALGLHFLGSIGVSIAFAFLYLFVTAGIALIARRLSGYTFQIRLFLPQIVIIICTFCFLGHSTTWIEIGVSLVLVGTTFILSTRSLLEMLPRNHRLLSIMKRIPLANCIFPALRF